MFIFPKFRLSSSSGMVIFVSKCHGAMACIPSRPPVQDLLISINDASGPIFMKDFLQTRFQRSRVAKQIQVIIKVAWVFYSAVLNGESLPPNICAMVKSWTRLAYCGWSSIHFYPVFCYSFILATISHYKEFLMVILTIYEHIYIY